jgi:predicted RNA-binding Zn-ribbon protein involved in translation (DUF1610 family)
MGHLHESIVGMPELVDSISCPKCGGPLNLTTGEVIVTCPYCGSSVRIRSDKPFLLRHSMLSAKIDQNAAMATIQGWMEGGIMKPDDLRRASRIVSLDCLYIPFYVFEVDATTSYKGVLTRLGTNDERSGDLIRNYFWKILARRSGDYAVEDYHIPLALKVPFDSTAMLKGARLLNAEVDEDESARLVQEQVDEHQRELLKDIVDVVENASTKVEAKDSEFLHAPLWFGVYAYHDRQYKIVVDAASGDVVKGDIPTQTAGLGEILRGAKHGMFGR